MTVHRQGTVLPGCDVLLVTATDRETKALIKALSTVSTGESTTLRGERRTYVDHGKIADARVVRVRTEMGSGTPGGSASTVAEAIRDVAPRAIVMVGIAFGMDAKSQKIGTILVSKQLQDYALRRVSTDRVSGTERVVPRGDRVSASVTLVDRLRHAVETWRGERIEFGLVLSGEDLVDNLAHREQLKALFPEAIGGEMEGRGLYAEAAERAQWIVVKAICDWADGNKGVNKARNQLRAAKAAARFVVHTLKLGGLGNGHAESRLGGLGAPTSTATPYQEKELSIAETYFASVCRRLAATPRLRTRRAAFVGSNRIVQISASVTESTFAPSSGDVLLLTGRGGRGKTTALTMLANRFCAEVPRRVPVFLDPYVRERSLVERVGAALQLHLRGEPSEGSVSQWLQLTPTAIIVDDWHLFSAVDRSALEAAFRALSGLPTIIIIASTPDMKMPQVPGIRQIELLPYTVEERDAAIHAALTESGLPRVGAMIQSVESAGLFLREPVVLDAFLCMILAAPPDSTERLRSLPELMDRVLHAVCPTPVDPSALASAGSDLASVGRRFSRSEIEHVTSPEIASALVSGGLVVALGIDAYTFSSELWRNYFVALRCMNREWSTTEGVARWVGEASESVLADLLPFISCLMPTCEHYHALFEALLLRGVTKYALGLRSSSGIVAAGAGGVDGQREAALLSSLAIGYYDLVGVLASGFRSFLEPWRHGCPEIVGGEMVPIISGRLHEQHVTFYAGFAPPNSKISAVEPSPATQPIFAPARGERTYYDILPDGADPLAFGRRRAATLLFDQIEDLLKRQKLPLVGWVALEEMMRIIRTLILCDVVRQGAWHWTPTRILKWALARVKRLARQGTAAEEDVFRPIGATRAPGAFTLQDILETASVLSRSEHSTVPLSRLELPAPDVPEADLASEYYSDEQKKSRIRTLFRAVEMTYRDVCSHMFGEYENVWDGLLVSQFPCQAVIYLRPSQQDGGPHGLRAFSTTQYWKVAERWGSEPEIIVGVPPPINVIERIAAQQRHECDRLGRPFVEFATVQRSSRLVFSGVWRPVVTEFVCELLQDDMKRLTQALGPVRLHRNIGGCREQATSDRAGGGAPHGSD